MVLKPIILFTLQWNQFNCPDLFAAAIAFSLDIIWNSWNRWDILWPIFRYFSVQLRAHFSSLAPISRVVKSYIQSMKQISDSLLYEARKSRKVLICSGSTSVGNCVAIIQIRRSLRDTFSDNVYFILPRIFGLNFDGFKGYF